MSPAPLEPLDERLTFGPIIMDVLATADTTGGAMTAIVEVPPLLDTPLHVHANEDELFVALEGDHVITRGEEEIAIGPGQASVRPTRRPPRSSGGRSRDRDGSMFVCTPGGLEGFFRALDLADSEDRLGPEAYAEASERFGITWL